MPDCGGNLQHSRRIKAGTLFHPLFRLYLPVMVQVGAQVAVTAPKSREPG